MGAGQGTALRLIDDEIELLRETRDFARWTLADVTQLHQRFQRTHGMAITESQFDNLLLLKASECVSSKEIFTVLDTNRDGRIDGLEFLASLLCVCRASFEEKARSAFELFDFNLNGSLSLTELALLMKSVWVGMSLLTGHAISKTLAAAVASPMRIGPSSASSFSGLPSSNAASTTVTQFLRLAQHAFDRFDRDGGASLQYEEFIEWARSNREFMLQVEQFRVISEKAVGFEETISLPDGSDVDSDLEEEATSILPTDTKSVASANRTPAYEEIRSAELSSSSSSSAAPWLLEPTKQPLATQKNDGDFPPPINVQLEWIYGYAGATTRNTVRVLANGDVVYVVSKYAVVYTPERHEQRFYFGHKFPITCLDVNASSTIIATGDAVPMANHHSEIHVWNALTLECVAVLSSFHVDSIASVAFPAPVGIQLSTPLTMGSSTGSGKSSSTSSSASAKKQHHAADSLLVSIGTDSNASMALWDWQNARLLASGRAVSSSKRKRVLCLAVSEDGHEILVAGDHFIVFHHVDGRFFKMKKPKGLETKLQTMPVVTSATYYGPHTAVVGTARGELLQFHNMQLIRVVQAHGIGQSINVCTLSCRSMVLFTAGKDGMLKQWDSTLQPVGNAIDLHTSASVKGLEEEDFRVHSLAYDATKQRFIVGTRHGHLITVSEASAAGGQQAAPTRVIVSSHRGGADVSGLATCRVGVCFATCSSADRTLRVWNMRRRVEQHAIKLQFPPSACVYSAVDGGEFLAVGGSDGSIALFRAKTMALLNRMQNTQSRVHCLRFHPSQAELILAVACVNGFVYLYSIDSESSKFHRFALLKPSPGEPGQAVVSLDFSTDGRFLKTQHGHSQYAPQGAPPTLRFWQVRASHQSVARITAMAVIRDIQWQSYSSQLGWHVSGLESSCIAALTANAASSVVASVTTRGQVAFHHFPCVVAESISTPFAIVVANAHLHGHEATASLGFALHDTLLLSTSSGLRARDSGSVVCQWAITKEVPDLQPRATPRFDSDEMWETLHLLGLDALYFHDETFVPRANSSAIDAVQPQMGAATDVAVSHSPSRTEAPDLDLSLAFAHGFNHHHSAMNQIMVAMSGSTTTASCLVYGAGTLLVSLLITAAQLKQQRVQLSGLHHDITSIVKPSNNILAVGSQRENCVFVWQWEPVAQLLSVLRGPPLASHVLTAFDTGEYSHHPHHHQHHSAAAAAPSDLAAAVWYSPSRHSHVIRFYHWRKGNQQQATTGNDDAHSNGDDQQAIEADMTRLPVLFGFFTPPLLQGAAVNPTNVGFVSGGVDHVSFWWLTVSTGHLVSQSGVFGRHAIVETALCGAYAAPFALTGMASGVVVVWDNGVAAFSFPLLEGGTAPGSSSSQMPGKKTSHVMSLVVVPAKQQIVAALRSGHVVLLSHAKESDLARYRANTFLQRLRVINVFDDACVWKMIPTSGASTKAGETTTSDAAAAQAKQAASMSSALQSVILLDDLQSGFAVVMSGGLVFHIDSQALMIAPSTMSSSYQARVVLDVGPQVSTVAIHGSEQWVAMGNTNGRVSVYHLDTQALLAETRALGSSCVRSLAWQNAVGGRLAGSLADGRLVVLNGASLSVEAEFPCGPNASNTNDSSLKKWCWVLKFSPGSSAVTWLAAACRNYHIYVYKASASSADGGSASVTWELAHDFAGHTAPITTLDFCLASPWLQSSTSSVDCQLLRWALTETADSDASSKATAGSVGDASAWATWTVPFSGPVAGLSDVFGTSVTAVDRIIHDKPLSQVDRWSSKLPTVVVGTETGRVLLGWYPLRCGDGKSAMFKEYDGYYATDALVGDASFSANNEYVVTRAVSGGSSSTSVTLVWKTDYEEEVRLLERVQVTNGNTSGVTPSAPAAMEPPVADDALDASSSTTTALLQKDDQWASSSISVGGDEFLAVKPWLGAVREPSVLLAGVCLTSSGPQLPPTASMALEFVYGVNANATETHNDVFYADDSHEIVYAAASFGVVYNTKTRTQLVNGTHSGQMVSCLAVHPVRGDLVVTGEIAGGKKKPRLVAWDANSGSTITQIESVHTRGVALLAFSPSGDRVASVGMDDDHVLAIYALSSSTQGLAKWKLLAQMKSSKQPVYTLAFHFDSDAELVTGGHKHVLFWSTVSSDGPTSAATSSSHRHRAGAGPSGGSSKTGAAANDGALTLSMKKGLFGSHGNGANAKVLASVYVPRSQQQSHVVTGQQDGSLFVWKARQCVDAKVAAHAGAIYALVVGATTPPVVYSGGQDGKINLWNPQLELLVQLDLAKLGVALGSGSELFNSNIKSLAVRESRILFSTDGGDVAELVPETNTHQASLSMAHPPSYKLQIHLRSHCKGELWGLASHPTKMQFVSAGDDGSVRLWDAPTRSPLAMYTGSSVTSAAKNGSHKWRALAFSCDGSHIVAGGLDGHVLVLNEALDTVVATWKCCAKAVAVVKFDSESRLLAIGTHDQSIYIYDGHTYKPKGVCKGHSSTVDHLDFSVDGGVLQSTSTAGELLFWDVRVCKQIPSATTVRDTNWASWTLPFGWPVQGIWPPGSDGSDVNAVARSGDRRVVATGDDFGLVKLFEYPCIAAHSQATAFAGHASHVTNCCFMKDDLYFLSSGGLDNTVCQYRYSSQGK